MRALAPLGLALVLAVPILAHADAIGGCPQGQIWRSNPTSPGAMHHGGGACIPDPSASHGCAIATRCDHAALAITVLAGAAILIRRHREERGR
jgi:hypothetical protein